MEGKKVFVNKRGMATFLCPECGMLKNAPVEKFKGIKHSLSIKCPCGNIFTVILDYRQQYRKNTNLSGHYKILALSQEKEAAQSANGDSEETEEFECSIINLSMTGLRMRLRDPNPAVATGTILHIAFQLDDNAKTEIDREVVVKNITDHTLGCEYTDPGLYDKVMGFYLLP